MSLRGINTQYDQMNAGWSESSSRVCCVSFISSGLGSQKRKEETRHKKEKILSFLFIYVFINSSNPSRNTQSFSIISYSFISHKWRGLKAVSNQSSLMNSTLISQIISELFGLKSHKLLCVLGNFRLHFHTNSNVSPTHIQRRKSKNGFIVKDTL